MPLLTKPSTGLGAGYASRYKRLELIGKLGAIEYKAMEQVTEICDSICKHREQVADSRELDDLCETCPLNRLRELIE